MTILEAALEYAKKGFSVIPIGQDKVSLIKWEPYQKKRASEEEIRIWFKKFPSANVGIVTGEISNLLVVDCDTPISIQQIQDAIPESLIVPCEATPRGGMHFFFSHTEGFVNRARVAEGIDVRTEGGYCVVAPSVNGTGKSWKWFLSLLDADPPYIINSITSLFNSYSLYSKSQNGLVTNVNKVTQVTDYFTEGKRNDTLFHIASCLIKGGAEQDFLDITMTLLGNNCDPPLPEKEIKTIIQSALNRPEKRNFRVSEWFTDWAKSQIGHFRVTDSHSESPESLTQKDKHTIVVTASRLCEAKILEHIGKRSGTYRVIDKKVEFMDFLNVDMEDILDIKLPLNAHRKTLFFPKSVIVVAGVTGMGKTTFALNVVKDNMDRYKIYYFNSEMSRQALNKKLTYFGIPLDQWRMKAIAGEKWDHTNIADKVFPDDLNIIDYLEPESDKPYGIHEVISAIVNNLNRGMALITVQKRPTSKLGTGGIYSAKASSFYLALDWGTLEIIKNRYREEDADPKANFIDFEIIHGSKFESKTGWYNKSVKIRESKYDDFIKEN